MALVLDADNAAVVMNGQTAVAGVGDNVRLGGGEIGPDLVPHDAAAKCGELAWGVSEVVPPLEE